MRTGSPPTVVLSHEYWQRVFGGNPHAIGQSLVMDGTPTQVIGVLPAGFRFLRENPALVAAVPPEPGRGVRRQLQLLRVGAPEARARPSPRPVPTSRGSFPAFPITSRCRPGSAGEMYDEVRLAPEPPSAGSQDVVGDIGSILWVLLGAVGIVLLVACANIANLFLVRAEGRQQELAIRSALGASRMSGDRRVAGRKRFTLSAGAGAARAWRSPTVASACSWRSTPPSFRAWTRLRWTRSFCSSCSGRRSARPSCSA